MEEPGRAARRPAPVGSGGGGRRWWGRGRAERQLDREVAEEAAGLERLEIGLHRGKSGAGAGDGQREAGLLNLSEHDTGWWGQDEREKAGPGHLPDGQDRVVLPASDRARADRLTAGQCGQIGVGQTRSLGGGPGLVQAFGQCLDLQVGGGSEVGEDGEEGEQSGERKPQGEGGEPA